MTVFLADLLESISKTQLGGVLKENIVVVFDSLADSTDGTRCGVGFLFTAESDTRRSWMASVRVNGALLGGGV